MKKVKKGQGKKSRMESRKNWKEQKEINGEEKKFKCKKERDIKRKEPTRE